jgi:hypothetical protein
LPFAIRHAYGGGVELSFLKSLKWLLSLVLDARGIPIGNGQFEA